jgi:hypothetical protein
MLVKKRVGGKLVTVVEHDEFVSNAVSDTVAVLDTDNTQLFSGNITTTGPGSWITMTGYHSLAVQLSGSWSGSLIFETSNDQTAIDAVLVHSRDDLALMDQIDQNGMFTIRSSGKYIRYNVTYLSGTITAVILGKTTDALSPADKLSFAMDKQLNMPLFTEVTNPGLRDKLGATILSDASDPIYFQSISATVTPKIIDTSGYNTMVIHMVTAGAVTPTTSNDQINWLGMVGFATTAPQTQVTTATASVITTWPLTGRFVKLTGPASLVSAVIYLRQVTWSNNISNVGTVGTVTSLTQFGGTNIVTGGVAGMLAVGGNIASGTAPTANPVQIGGVDAGRLNSPGAVAAGLTPKTRRALTDEQGRFIPPNVELTTGLNFQNATAAFTKDTNQHESNSLIEIMAHILVELRTLNWQIHELPISIGANTMNPSDDLDDIRTEMKAYNYNN